MATHAHTPSLSWSADLQAYFSKSMLNQLNSPTILTVGSPLKNYRDQNELDVRWNSIESLGDIMTLRQRFMEQSGNQPKQIVITPEQNALLAADTTGKVDTSVKMKSIFGMKIYVRERDE